jgi:hypothetical protein
MRRPTEPATTIAAIAVVMISRRNGEWWNPDADGLTVVATEGTASGDAFDLVSTAAFDTFGFVGLPFWAGQGKGSESSSTVFERYGFGSGPLGLASEDVLAVCNPAFLRANERRVRGQTMRLPMRSSVTGTGRCGNTGN